MAYFGSMMENPFAWLRTQGRSVVVYLYLLCIAAGGVFIITSAVAQEQEYVPFKALYASIDGGISPAQVDLVAGALAEAQDMEAGIVVIRLDTSGGLVASMRDIVKLVLNAPVPVAVWVGPSGARAASAGTFIVAAANIASMAPQTSIGAASPVEAGGKDVNETMKKKVTQDLQSFVRGVVKARSRNVEWYLRAITEAESITASEAVEKNVIDFVAENPRQVLIKAGKQGIERNGIIMHFDGSTADIVPFEPGLRYKFLSWLLDPSIAYFLLLGGLAGLFFELTTPGAVFPGVLGGICLLLGLYAMSILPTNVAGVLLILFGVLLFLLEVWITSYGMLSVAAVVAIFTGSMILFRVDGGFPGLPITTIVITTAGISILIGAAIYLAARARLSRPQGGMQALKGEVASVITWDGDHGQVMIRGEIWSAVTHETHHFAKGEKVRVIATEGLTLGVEPLFQEHSDHNGEES